MDKKTRKAKVLIYDIETSYTVGAVWGLYEQNVAKVIRDPYMLTVAYKWQGDKTVKVMSLPQFPLYKKDKKSDKALVAELWKLFDEADIIVAHNGNSFDQKWAYARFLVNGMLPPSQAKYVDTKLVAKNKFRFNSNSLNNLGKYLGLGEKIDTGGIDLWTDCIEEDKKSAWNLMCKYNKQDVILLEKVYDALLPYMTNHPNLNLLYGTINNCPNCHSPKLQKRGFALLKTTTKQRYQCTSCGSWCQEGKVMN